MARNKLKFLRNGVPVELAEVGPNETLLDYLRLRERKTGTKEGCNEGDCGACTVVLGRLRDGRLSYEPVNACILMLGQIDGCDLITVDDLANEGGANEGGAKDGAGSVGGLHPVQEAFVELHASQCGFCTPGFVMSVFALLHSGREVTREAVNEYVAGNLCRCTGYRPIAEAAIAAGSKRASDALDRRWKETEKMLAAIGDREDLFIGSPDRFFAAPASIDSLARLAEANPDATILAGSTDVGLWVTKQLRELPKIIHVGRAKGFDAIRQGSRQLVIGAGATYAQAFDALGDIDPDIREMLLRLGSRQVRASGTVGGNIANGSPIGDTPPMLIALGASLELRKGDNSRTLPLEDFFIAYGKQDRAAGEIVTRIVVPLPRKKDHVRVYKISKRFDQDISALLFATRITVENGRVASARIACGGMAATPKRALHAEAALGGARLDDPASWQRAVDALAKDYQPISDMRASAEYRLKVAANLLVKAMTEIGSANAKGGDRATRVRGFREAAE